MLQKIIMFTMLSIFAELPAILFIAYACLVVFGWAILVVPRIAMLTAKAGGNPFGTKTLVGMHVLGLILLSSIMPALTLFSSILINATEIVWSKTTVIGAILVGGAFGIIATLAFLAIARDRARLYDLAGQLRKKLPSICVVVYAHGGTRQTGTFEFVDEAVDHEQAETFFDARFLVELRSGLRIYTTLPNTHDLGESFRDFVRRA